MEGCRLSSPPNSLVKRLPQLQLTTLARKLDKVSARNTFPIHNKDWSESPVSDALASPVSSPSSHLVGKVLSFRIFEPCKLVAKDEEQTPNFGLNWLNKNKYRNLRSNRSLSLLSLHLCPKVHIQEKRFSFVKCYYYSLVRFFDWAGINWKENLRGIEFDLYERAKARAANQNQPTRKD